MAEPRHRRAGPLLFLALALSCCRRLSLPFVPGHHGQLQGRSTSEGRGQRLPLRAAEAGAEAGEQEIWQQAASAAVHSLLHDKMNASTVLMPSGANDVLIGRETIVRVQKELGAPFRAVHVVPPPLTDYARELYAELEADFDIVRTDRSQGVRDARRVAEILKSERPTIFVCNYHELMSLVLAHDQLRDRKSGEEPVWLQLVVLDAAHLVRAGGYTRVSSDCNILPAERRLFISSRRLVGLPPGALLAPGQEPGAPEELDWQHFGPEVYRMTHDDAAEKKLTVPVKIFFVEATGVNDVANELSDLHMRLGIKNVEVVPPQVRMSEVLNVKVRNLTNGALTVKKVGQDRDLDAILISGSMPSYVAIAQEFTRLARWAPGKESGYIIISSASRVHSVAAWRALLTVEESAELAMQRATIHMGYTDKTPKWNDVPKELMRLMHQDSDRANARMAVLRGVQDLGDPFDLWLGRIRKWQELKNKVDIDGPAFVFGHPLWKFIQDMRDRWKNGALPGRKLNRLRAMGVVLDVPSERFARGLEHLRRYVKEQKTRNVPTSLVMDDGFQLGYWVWRQRVLQRRGQLPYEKMKMLREAFFMWRPVTPSTFFLHSDNEEAAKITRAIEEELRSLRNEAMVVRKKHFKSLVLKHHPDMSESKYAKDTISFLADVKEWFLTTSY